MDGQADFCSVNGRSTMNAVLLDHLLRTHSLRGREIESVREDDTSEESTMNAVLLDHLLRTRSLRGREAKSGREEDTSDR